MRSGSPGSSRRGDVGDVVEVDGALGVPAAVRPARGDLALHRAVVDDASSLDVDQEDLARLQPSLGHHVGRVRRGQHAGLAGQHHEAVAGELPAAGPQAVAVERGADHAAVGERHRRRAVPGLHETRVVGVEVAQLRGHVVAPLPRLGDHQHQRVGQRAAGQHEQLEHVVEGRRVAPARAHDRHQLAQVGAEQVALELRLAGAHPVHVAAQGVDLAVVGDQAVRVRELPARERVRWRSASAPAPARWRCARRADRGSSA